MWRRRWKGRRKKRKKEQKVASKSVKGIYFCITLKCITFSKVKIMSLLFIYPQYKVQSLTYSKPPKSLYYIVYYDIAGKKCVTVAYSAKTAKNL